MNSKVKLILAKKLLLTRRSMEHCHATIGQSNENSICNISTKTVQFT